MEAVIGLPFHGPTLETYSGDIAPDAGRSAFSTGLRSAGTYNLL